MKHDFSDLVDVEMLRSLLEGFTTVSGTPSAILDIHGKVLATAGWRDICTRFHRVHPTTRARCVESDTRLAGQLKLGEKYTLYKCRNGLVDVASPIIVEGVHVGNAFVGQLLLAPPDIEFFRKQAAEFGFDETAYLGALASVPIRAQEELVGILGFLSSLAELIGTMGLAKKRLLALNAELSIRSRIAEVFLTAADEDVYREVLRIALSAVESPQGGFGCLDENGSLARRASIGDLHNSCSAAPAPESWENILCGRAMAEKRTIYSNEPATPSSSEGVLARRHLCSPIVYHQNAIGVLLAVDKATDYGQDDVRMLEAVANYIAPILHARLRAKQQEKDRKRVEDERSRLAAMLEATNDLVATATPDGHLTFLNRAGRKMLGLTGDEDVTRRSIAEAHRPDVANHILNEAVPVALREGIWTGETSILCPDGTDIPVSQVIMAHRSEDGSIDYLSTIMRDVTERRRAETERDNLIARLEAQNAELERFVYTVSHDLKSPLITMQGFLGALREDLANADQEGIEDDLHRMDHAAKVMGGLLDDLLELSRIGRLASPPENVPLNEVAREAAELVAGSIKARGIEVAISPNLPLVFADRLRLLEVLQNLIDNAAKYMGDQPRPRIEIGAREEPGQWVCHVRDNGIGIEPRYQEKVFGLFEQLDPKVEGSGVGLALVKRIVEFHGGRVWVESEGVGRGAAFYFSLPREAPVA